MKESDLSGRTIKPKTKKTTLSSDLTISAIALVIGVASIIISPSRDSVFFFVGIILLVVGGIGSAISIGKFISAQSNPAPAPITYQSDSPKTIEVGNTPDEVQAVMGTPDKIINLGGRVIHVYDDMKITYVEDKVTDVQLS